MKTNLKPLIFSALIITLISCGQNSSGQKEEALGLEATPPATMDTTDIINIGNNTWMTSNLQTTKFRNGESIAEATSWDAFKLYTGQGTPAYYKAQVECLGNTQFFYNYPAVSSPNGLLPYGYKLPSYEDFSELAAAGELFDIMSETGWSGRQQGTNTTGFNAFPTGWLTDGIVMNACAYAYWWTSTSDNDTNTVAILDYTSAPSLIPSTYPETQVLGIGVRCIEDTTQTKVTISATPFQITSNAFNINLTYGIEDSISDITGVSKLGVMLDTISIPASHNEALAKSYSYSIPFPDDQGTSVPAYNPADSMVTMELPNKIRVTPGTTIYARPYLYIDFIDGNSTQHAYVFGDEVSFKTLSLPETGPSGGNVIYDRGDTLAAGGWRYIEVAPESYFTKLPYGCSTVDITAPSDYRFASKVNCDYWMENCTETSAEYAIPYCVALEVNDNQGWYLPGLEEKDLLLFNTNYASSATIWISRFQLESSYSFPNNSIYPGSKNRGQTYKVIPIRYYK